MPVKKEGIQEIRRQTGNGTSLLYLLLEPSRRITWIWNLPVPEGNQSGKKDSNKDSWIDPKEPLHIVGRDTCNTNLTSPVKRSTEHKTAEQEEKDNRRLSRHAIDILITRDITEAVERMVKANTECGDPTQCIKMRDPSTGFWGINHSHRGLTRHLKHHYFPRVQSRQGNPFILFRGIRGTSD